MDMRGTTHGRFHVTWRCLNKSYYTESFYGQRNIFLHIIETPKPQVLPELKRGHMGKSTITSKIRVTQVL